MSRCARRESCEAYEGYDTELRTPSHISRGSSGSSFVERQLYIAPQRRSRRHSISSDSKPYPGTSAASYYYEREPERSEPKQPFRRKTRRSSTNSPPISFDNCSLDPDPHPGAPSRSRHHSSVYAYFPRFRVAERPVEPEERSNSQRSSSRSSRRSSSRHDSGYDYTPSLVDSARAVRFTSPSRDLGFDDPYTAAPSPSVYLRSESSEDRSRRQRPGGSESSRTDQRDSHPASSSSRGYMDGLPYSTFVAHPQPSATQSYHGPYPYSRPSPVESPDVSQPREGYVEVKEVPPKLRRREGHDSLLAAFKNELTKGNKVSVASVRLAGGAGIDIVAVSRKDKTRRGRGRRRSEVDRLW